MTATLIIAFIILLNFAPVVCIFEIPFTDEEGNEYKGIHCNTILFNGLRMKAKHPAVHIIPSFLI